jgi:MYXO-CTERM domain-containing protein
MEFQMRNKTLTSSMAGALLFGGTLGVSAVASAGVVAFGGATTANSWCAIDVSAYNHSSYSSDVLSFASGNPVSGAVSLADATYGNATCSQFTSSGVSITTSFTSAALAGGATPSITFRQAFSVTAAVVMNWSALLPPSSGGFLHIDVVGGSGSSPRTYWDGTNGTLTLAANGAGEHYLLSYTSFGAAIQSGTALSVSFAPVPAPGALALLGVAGLAGGRRRRA